MATVETGRVLLSPEDYAVLGENDFGMAGLQATETIGPFVECQGSGPLIMIHDAIVEARLGIGHHPHRLNERLFYILRGTLDHDDALNGITGHMGTNDLARLTEGRRGMYHKEWNNGDEDTRAFILVYQTDPVPPTASFAALRDAEAPRYDESPGVRTKELVGPRSPLEINGDIRLYTDATFEADAALSFGFAEDESVLLYPLEGSFSVDDAKLEEGHTLIVTPDARERRVEVRALSAGRLLRVVHGAGDGVEFGRPYRRG
ncbi:MAG TPA: pirin family protein [Actinomycetota bacterium]|nr:pirin family protein [Actinomycetota bacterium]